MNPQRIFTVTLLAISTLVLTSASELSAETKAKAAFQWKANAEKHYMDLYFGTQPVLRYMHAYDASTPESFHETYKVFHHVFGPGSQQIITKGPGGKYTHHRGLYVGWSKTKVGNQMYDFWHCKDGAHLKHVKVIRQAADEKAASMTVEIHWNNKKDETMIREERTVVVSLLKEKPEEGWQIDWSTKLESQQGEIELNGDRQHAGFQFRAAQPVADANGATYIRPEGFPQDAKAFQVGDKGNPPAHINLGWFAMSYELDKKRYTIEYLEAPKLPKPSLYSERPYGRFGAFFKTKLTKDKPLNMHYRINVTTGEPPTQQEIQKRYNAWVAEFK